MSGLNKFDALSKFFNSVLDGTADLKVADEEVKAEEVVPNEEQQKQEAQYGFADSGDFQNAVKNEESDAKDSTTPPKEEKASEEEVNSAPEEVIAPNEGGQVVFEATTETESSAKPVEEPPRDEL